MISENRKLEFWNFLIAEKNQPRPKGITTQRLVVIRPAIFSLDDLWVKIVGLHEIGDLSAVDFYASKEPAAINFRTEFWNAVRKLIRQQGNKASKQSQPLTGKIQSRRESISRKRYK
jgi:hypothetical protein